jgi:hypothetical protein
MTKSSLKEKIRKQIHWENINKTWKPVLNHQHIFLPVAVSSSELQQLILRRGTVLLK